MDLRTQVSKVLTVPYTGISGVTFTESQIRPIRNRFGYRSFQYVVWPPNVPRTKKVPVIFIVYPLPIYDSSLPVFLTQTFPVQTFADLGYAVSIVRMPTIPGLPLDQAIGYDTFRRTKFVMEDNPTATVEAALADLHSTHRILTTKVAVIGHSLGGFLTEYLVTHRSFMRAGIAVEPDSHDATNAWLYGDQFSWAGGYGYGLYNGDPLGSGYHNLLVWSPARAVTSRTAPLMIEHDEDRVDISMELYGELREHHVPTVLYLYPNDGHIFSVPSHQLYSMIRMIRWLNRWLR